MTAQFLRLWSKHSVSFCETNIYQCFVLPHLFENQIFPCASLQMNKQCASMSVGTLGFVFCG